MSPITANNYTIYFNDNGYDSLLRHLQKNQYSKIVILADSNTSENCLPQFMQKLATESPIEIIEIESGESMKTIETCVEVWNALTDIGADRKSVLINVGGGVVTDLGGFVASTYKRGIDFINVPTTLLAMVDASVGGKNGVDLGNLKNQVGVINVPQLVLIDTSFLETLPQNQMRSGLAEMLKHGLIADKEYWQKFIDLSQFDYADFDLLIYRSIEIKNDIVLRDPTENGIRKALNFGHTIGHAIESYFLNNADKTELLHGEAIAAGMIIEANISLQKQLLSVQEYSEIKSVVNSIFDKIKLSDSEIAAIIGLLVHDKKNEYGKIQFALPDRIGGVKVGEFAENKLIISAFADYET